MSRHKGQRSPAQIDRDYPHQVEIEIPAGGLGNRYHPMDALCRQLGPYAVRAIGKQRIERNRDAMRWCFADPAHADAFHKQFGGSRLTAR